MRGYPFLFTVIFQRSDKVSSWTTLCNYCCKSIVLPIFQRFQFAPIIKMHSKALKSFTSFCKWIVAWSLCKWLQDLWCYNYKINLITFVIKKKHAITLPEGHIQLWYGKGNTQLRTMFLRLSFLIGNFEVKGGQLSSGKVWLLFSNVQKFVAVNEILKKGHQPAAQTVSSLSG